MVIKATLIVMDLALNVEPPVFLTRLKYECECPRSGLLHMFLSIQAQATPPLSGPELGGCRAEIGP